MKKIKLICGILLSIIISLAAFTVAVGAEGDAVPHNLISSGAQGSDTVPVSYGLDVIAASKEMTVTGISGNPHVFFRREICLRYESFPCGLHNGYKLAKHRLRRLVYRKRWRERGSENKSGGSRPYDL